MLFVLVFQEVSRSFTPSNLLVNYTDTLLQCHDNKYYYR